MLGRTKSEQKQRREALERVREYHTDDKHFHKRMRDGLVMFLFWEIADGGECAVDWHTRCPRRFYRR